MEILGLNNAMSSVIKDTKAIEKNLVDYPSKF